MKKKYLYKIMLSVLVLQTVCFTSCIDDWTENESIEIKQPNIGDKNPELYAEYLEMLRQYKASCHKTMLVSFDNSEKNPVSRGQHIDVIPDSVDYVELQYPENIVERELDEMNNTRTLKGTKFLYTISYAALEKEYLAKTEEDEAGFLSFIHDYISQKLSLVTTFSYDGVIISYMGQGILHATEEEIAIYRGRQEAFLNPIISWAAKNSNKDLMFEGRPYNLLDKTILSRCRNIILPTSFAQSIEDVEKILRMSMREDIPVDKWVVSTQTQNIKNPDDTTTGFFNGKSAILETAYWLGGWHSDFTVAGIAIYNVQNDFYNIDKIYKNTREAISLIN